MKPVGILGGIRPAATVTLIQKVLSISNAQSPTDHVPLFVHHNPQVPSCDDSLVNGAGKDPMPVLMDMAQDLERSGAQAIAIPSVVAHHYALAITHASTLPLLDMVKLSAQHISALGANRIGILTSPAVSSADLFDATFKVNGLTPLWPKENSIVATLIEAAETKGPDTESSSMLEAEVEALLIGGADQVLIANAALSALAERLSKELPFTDCFDCLASEIVAFAKS